MLEFGEFNDTKNGGGRQIAAVKIKTNRRTALLHNNGIRCVLL